MTARWMTILILVLMAAPATAQKPSNTKLPASPGRAMNNREILANKDRASYAVGVSIGQGIRQQGVDVKLDAMVRGLKDALSGAKLQMSEEELKVTLRAFQTDLMRKRAQARTETQRARAAVAVANEKAGAVFLAANANRPGVVTQPSGLQYRVLREGRGPTPSAGDTVQVSYRGTLVDGTEFDSSYRRGTPATCIVNGVISGWSEALQRMPVGSKWQLFIPAQLAYGPRGSGSRIGPNATLIFEVELLAIQ